jgi:NitT/TauT family transport system substrate-binding protein
VREAHGSKADAFDGGLSRRTFVRRGATTFATTAVGGTLLAACGSDDSDSGSSSSGGSGGGGGGGKSLTEVTFLDILPPSMGKFADYIADVRGYFKAEGIKVTTEQARGSAPAIQALIAGKGLLTSVGLMENVLHIGNEGAPMVLVSNMQKQSPLAFVSADKNPITKPEDFRGQTVGVPSKGGTSELSLNALLASANIPEKEVKRQVTGISPGTFELVRKGRIAGYTVSGQDEARFKSALPDVVWMEEAEYVKDGYGYFATQDGLKNNRETIAGYIRAVYKATKDTIADKPNGYASILKDLRAKYDWDGLDDDDVSKAALDYLLKVRLVDGEQDLLIAKPDDMKVVYDQMVGIKAVKPGLDATKWVDATVFKPS